MNWYCKKCGTCCKFIVLNIGGMNADQKWWLSLHEKITIDGDKMIIRVKCKHLKKRNRKYFCDIHSKKPIMCTEAGERECELSKKEYEMEGT